MIFTKLMVERSDVSVDPIALVLPFGVCCPTIVPYQDHLGELPSGTMPSHWQIRYNSIANPGCLDCIKLLTVIFVKMERPKFYIHLSALEGKRSSHLMGTRSTVPRVPITVCRIACPKALSLSQRKPPALKNLSLQMEPKLICTVEGQ